MIAKRTCRKLVKIINKSIEMAFTLFPSAYESRQRYRTFHFAFIWRRNNLLSIGLNQPYKPNHKALYFAKKFEIPNKRFNFLHAETDAIRKLWGRSMIDSSMNLVVLRLNAAGQLKNSRPCKFCLPIIRALNFGKIFFSNEKGEVVRLND